MPKRLSFREVVLRRDPKTGRYVSKGKGGYIERVSYVRRGKFQRTLTIDSRRTILKQATVADEGPGQGKVFLALAKTNVMARKTLKGAKRIEVNISARDRRDKLQRIRFSIDSEGIKKPDQALLSRVLYEIQSRGYRTNYPVSVIPRKGRRRSKTATEKLKRLHKVKITVRIKK